MNETETNGLLGVNTNTGAIEIIQPENADRYLFSSKEGTILKISYKERADYVDEYSDTVLELDENDSTWFTIIDLLMKLLEERGGKRSLGKNVYSFKDMKERFKNPKLRGAITITRI